MPNPDRSVSIFDTSPTGIRRAVNREIAKAFAVPAPRPVRSGPRVVTTYSDGRKLIECNGQFYELDEPALWRSFGFGESHAE